MGASPWYPSRQLRHLSWSDYVLATSLTKVEPLMTFLTQVVQCQVCNPQSPAVPSAAIAPVIVTPPLAGLGAAACPFQKAEAPDRSAILIFLAYFALLGHVESS